MPDAPSPLIAILLVTQSAKSASEVAFRWPPNPTVRPRLSRPRPDKLETDGSWRAAYYDVTSGYDVRGNDEDDEDDDYAWTRPHVQQPRRSSISNFHHSPPRSSRGPASRTPGHSHSHHPSPAHRHDNDRELYTNLLGYRSSFLADILSPKSALCHQKFELIVDELGFLGHPVHAERDGGWAWEELYRSRAASFVEKNPDRPFIERGALGFDRGGEQTGSYSTRSGSFMDRPGLFTDRPEISDSPILTSSSSSFGGVGTPRASRSHNSLSEARGRMPNRPPFDLRMSSSDSFIPSPSPAITSSSATPISEASSESSTVAHPLNSAYVLPHLTSNSTSTSDADNAPQLTSFHLVLVFDRLDPQSVFARDLHQYTAVFYQQIAFKMTAVMHYEQGRSGWVARASEQLIAIRDECVVDGVPFSDYCERALNTSPLASAIKTVFESVTHGTVAHIQINEVPLDIQLPARHSSMLGGHGAHGVPEDGIDPDADIEQGPISACGEDEAEDEVGRAEDARRFGWWLPRLMPWKGLLLLEDAGPGTGAEMIVRMNSGRMSGGGNGSVGGDEDALADEDMFRKFLSYVQPTISLSDIAELSELNLRTDVYPMTRLLLYNRKARLVDVIPPGMKVMYTVSAAFKRPLSELSIVFSRLFSTVPPLPALLATITSFSRPFSSVIPSRDHREFYLEVLIWLLRHGLLEKLHLRVRIVATAEIRSATRAMLVRERENARLGREVAQVIGTRRHRPRRRRRSKASDEIEIHFAPAPGEMFEPSSPELVRPSRPLHVHTHSSHRRRRSSRSSMSSERLSRIPESLSVSEEALEEEEEDGIEEEEEGIDGTGTGVGELDGLLEDDAGITSRGSVIITEPAEATRLEIRWMEAMTEGKDRGITQKFKRLRKYFDGKVTADEILYREDITRRELREVIHHFDTYLSLLLAASTLGTPIGFETRQACSAVQLIHLAGSTENGLGIVGNPLSRALGTAIPGTTTYSVPYDTSAEYYATVAEGARMTEEYLTSQASRCPDQCFVLSGYSKGALVTHKTSLPSAVQDKVIAILVFGDPARNANHPWPINFPSVNQEPRNGSSDAQNIVSFCNKGDLFCDIGGNSLDTHLAYPNDGRQVLIKIAAIFTEKRLKYLSAV